MRVLVACEFSGIVRDAFRSKGHDAWSCDLVNPVRFDFPYSEYHIIGNVLEILHSQHWDLVIAHPPCTYLTQASVNCLYHPNDILKHWWQRRPNPRYPNRWEDMEKGAAFFNKFKECERYAIENPIPHRHARKLIGPYDQLTNAWHFGSKKRKDICWWLKGVPKLKRLYYTEPHDLNKHISKFSPSKERPYLRSIFYPEVAKAMAEQWS